MLPILEKKTWYADGIILKNVSWREHDNDAKYLTDTNKEENNYNIIIDLFSFLFLKFVFWLQPSKVKRSFQMSHITYLRSKCNQRKKLRLKIDSSYSHINEAVGFRPSNNFQFYFIRVVTNHHISYCYSWFCLLNYIWESTELFYV